MRASLEIEIAKESEEAIETLKELVIDRIVIPVYTREHYSFNFKEGDMRVHMSTKTLARRAAALPYFTQAARGRTKPHPSPACSPTRS